MFLTESNYHSIEASWEYLSASQYKDFCGTSGQRGCEAKAMAKLRGEWKDDASEAMLVGSFVDAHFEGTLELFKIKHPEIYKKDSDLRAAFTKAENIINRVERDELFMKAMSGEKQTILTAEMFGVMWKIKMDSYKKGEFITDLKVMKKLRERFWVKDLGYMSFVEFWGYDQQAAIYSAVEAIVSGAAMLPFYIAAVDKQKTPDMDLIGFDEDTKDLKSKLFEIERNVPRIKQVKSGQVEPDRCGECDYCRHTRKLEAPVYFRSLIEV